MKKSSKPKEPPIFLVRIVMRIIDFLWKLQRKLMPPQAVLFDHVVSDSPKNRSIYIAAELGIADILKDGPKSIDELAASTGTDSNALYRIMRVLTSIGIFKENKEKKFETNKMGTYLESDKEDTMVFFIKVAGVEWAYRTWGGLLECVKTGKDFYTNKYGESIFKWIEKNPQVQKAFDDGMTSVSALTDVTVASAYNYSSFKSIIDIGGGIGTQIVTILNAYPKMKGVLFELPATIENVKKEGIPEQEGLKGRLECVTGDFFKAVPEGHDAYFMKNILHDWNDEDSVKILINCRKAMRKDSTLMVVENIVKENNNEPDFSKMMDLNMMALFGGSCRTKAEWSRLFEKAGLKLTRVFHTTSPYKIIEAKPV